MNKKTVSLAVLIALLFSASAVPGCGPNNSASILPASNNTDVQDDLDPLRRDAEMYAANEGVSVDEAIRRFELQNEAGPLQAEIAKNEPDTYAGSWIQHQPESKYVLAFTRDGEETIKKYVKEGSPLEGLIDVRTLEVSYVELQATQKKTMELLESLGLFTDSGIDIQQNRVEVYVTDGRLFDETMQKAHAQLPAHVIQKIIYEPLYEVPFKVNPDPSVQFPQLKMGSGSFMELAMVGKLTLADGYLRAGDSLVIWQPDYFVNSNNGSIEILDRNGKVVARVGEEVVMGGGGISSVDEVNRLIRQPLPPDVKGPFFLQGGGTRLSLNFSSDLFGLEVITSGQDKVYFLKKKPRLYESAGQEIVLTGKLVASYNGVITAYPSIMTDERPEQNRSSVRYTTFWPADYEARVDGGVLEILDGSGAVVIRDGQYAELIGRVIYDNTDVTWQLIDELPGGYFQPYLIVDNVQATGK